MKQILSVDYMSVYHQEDINILYIEWAKKASNMSIDEFQRCIIAFVSLLGEYKARGFLVNSKKGHFTMGTDAQAWHDEVIAPQYLTYGLEKIGFVLPEKDFFAAISLQQTFEEAQAKQLQTRFFSDLEEALAWMK